MTSTKPRREEALVLAEWNKERARFFAYHASKDAIAREAMLFQQNMHDQCETYLRAYADTLAQESREAGWRAGESVGKCPVFGELIAVPLDQMQDIYEELCKVVDRAKWRFTEWDSMTEEDRSRRGDIFNYAEHAQMLAGNWGRPARPQAQADGEQGGGA